MSLDRMLATTAALITTAVLAVSCDRPPRFEYDFEAPDALETIEWKCHTLLALTPDHATSGSRSLMISFFPDTGPTQADYPGLYLSAFPPDWTGRRTLMLDVYNPEDGALQLNLRIDDRESARRSDRFRRSLTISPGMNNVAVPLSELVTQRTMRPLDQRKIVRVVLYLANPQTPHTLYVDHVRLE